MQWIGCLVVLSKIIITGSDLGFAFTVEQKGYRISAHEPSNTVVEYIQRVKIEEVKRSFESSSKNITEVMFDAGYTDTKTFRAAFKKITGLTPIEYRNKYNKQVMTALVSFAFALELFEPILLILRRY